MKDKLVLTLNFEDNDQDFPDFLMEMVPYETIGYGESYFLHSTNKVMRKVHDRHDEVLIDFDEMEVNDTVSLIDVI